MSTPWINEWALGFPCLQTFHSPYSSLLPFMPSPLHPHHRNLGDQAPLCLMILMKCRLRLSWDYRIKVQGVNGCLLRAICLGLLASCFSFHSPSWSTKAAALPIQIQGLLVLWVWPPLFSCIIIIPYFCPTPSRSDDGSPWHCHVSGNKSPNKQKRLFEWICFPVFPGSLSILWPLSAMMCQAAWRRPNA